MDLHLGDIQMTHYSTQDACRCFIIHGSNDQVRLPPAQKYLILGLQTATGERQLCTLLQVFQLFLSLKPLRYQLQITHCLEGLGLLIPRWDLSLSRVAESSLSISVSPCIKIDYSASFPSTLSCPKPLGCLVTSLNFAFRYGLLE